MEGEGELLGEDMHYSTWVVSPGRGELRKEALVWDRLAEDPPELIVGAWDEPLRSFWQVLTGNVLVRNGRKVGAYDSEEAAKLAARDGVHAR